MPEEQHGKFARGGGLHGGWAAGGEEFRAARHPIAEMDDDEDEENHDGACVDDDLYGGDERRAQQEIKDGERDHYEDQSECAVDGLTGNDEDHGAGHGDGGANEEQDERKR